MKEQSMIGKGFQMKASNGRTINLKVIDEQFFETDILLFLEKQSGGKEVYKVGVRCLMEKMEEGEIWPCRLT